MFFPTYDEIFLKVPAVLSTVLSSTSRDVTKVIKAVESTLKKYCDFS